RRRRVRGRVVRTLRGWPDAAGTAHHHQAARRQHARLHIRSRGRARGTVTRAGKQSSLTLMLLAIDTATSHAGIALMDARGLCGATAWQSERNHTVELVPNVVRLMADCRVSAPDLKAVALTSGP